MQFLKRNLMLFDAKKLLCFFKTSILLKFFCVEQNIRILFVKNVVISKIQAPIQIISHHISYVYLLLYTLPFPLYLLSIQYIYIKIVFFFNVHLFIMEHVFGSRCKQQASIFFTSICSSMYLFFILIHYGNFLSPVVQLSSPVFQYSHLLFLNKM